MSTIPNITNVADFPDEWSSYGYRPSLTLNGVALVLFGFATLIHLGMTVRTKKWWTILLSIGGLLECIGYGARIYSASSHVHLFDFNAFLVQICLLVIAPVIFAAANYTILGILVSMTGLESSALAATTGHHKYFTIIFAICDFISLILQSTGGALASLANTLADENLGTNIMVGGIVFQTFTTAVFMILYVDYYRRCFKNKPSLVSRRSWQRVMIALAISTICIETRSIYRSVELGQGWKGYLITHEPYFLVLDSLMMVLFIYTHLLVFPGKHLKRLRNDIDEDIQGQRDIAETVQAEKGYNGLP